MTRIPVRNDKSEDESVVHVCQGPPRCMLEGDDAIAAQIAGCIWCKRIFIDSDGDQRIVEPGCT